MILIHIRHIIVYIRSNGPAGLMGFLWFINHTYSSHHRLYSFVFVYTCGYLNEYLMNQIWRMINLVCTMITVYKRWCDAYVWLSRLCMFTTFHWVMSHSLFLNYDSPLLEQSSSSCHSILGNMKMYSYFMFEWFCPNVFGN